MPIVRVTIVRVTMFEGRTPETKRELARALTDAMVRVAGAKTESVEVIFEEVARRDWARGGELYEDVPAART